MQMPKILALVRHGTSEVNDGHNNLFNGIGDINPSTIINQPAYTSRLRNPKGINEAISAGNWLKDNMPGWDAGYTSPFIRTIETASYLFDTNKDFWRIEYLLRERDWGDFDIVPTQDIFDHNKPRLEACLNGHWLMKPPGGESIIDVLVRVVLFNDILARRNSNQRVLAATHSEYIKAAAMYYLSWPLAEMEEFEKTWKILSKPANCQIVLFDKPDQNGRFSRIKSVVPWDQNHTNNLDWAVIKPRRYSTPDLKKIIEKYPLHFDS